jgi:hypothetical protein
MLVGIEIRDSELVHDNAVFEKVHVVGKPGVGATV